MTTSVQNTTYVSDYMGGSTVDFNQPYMGPGYNCAVHYNGKFYTNGYYDENGQENVVIDLDAGTVPFAGGYTHAWGMSGGECVCINSTYVYVATKQANQGSLYDSLPDQFPPYAIVGVGTVSTAGSITGTATKYPSNNPSGVRHYDFTSFTANSLNLQIIVNGTGNVLIDGIVQTVVIPSSNYSTASSIATVINTAISNSVIPGGFSASEVGSTGQLNLTTNNIGTNAKISVKSESTTHSLFGFDFTISNPTYDLTAWTGFVRKNTADMTASGGFSGAAGIGWNFKAVNTFYEQINNVATGIDATFKGLACSETEVFCSDPYNGRIVVLDYSSLAQLRVLSIANTSYITMANDGNVWAIVGGTTVKKINKTTGAVITTVTPTNPVTKIGTLSDGSLWLNDTITYQILIYNSSGSSLTETYGASGGSMGNNGAIGGKNFGPILGFYRNGSYSYVMWQFAPSIVFGAMATKHDDSNSGQIVNKLYSLMFFDCPDFSSDGTEIHGHFHKYSFNPNASSGQQATLSACTWVESNSLADYRGTWFTKFAHYRQFLGKTFIFDSIQTSQYWNIREVVPGVSRTRPAGLFKGNDAYTYAGIWKPTDDGTLAPVAGDWSYEPPGQNAWAQITVDNNGTFWSVIWKPPAYNKTTAYLKKLPCNGLDAHNNPIYQWASATDESLTSLMDDPCRFYYDVNSDSGLLCGNTLQYPISTDSNDPINSNFYFGWAGRVFIRYNNWVSGPRTTRWTIVAPYAGGPQFIEAVSFDGQLLVLGQMYSSVLYCYDWNNGNYIGTIISNGITGSNGAWIDSQNGIKVKRFSSTDYRILCQREIGGSCLLFNVKLYHRYDALTRSTRTGMTYTTSRLPSSGRVHIGE